MTAPRADVARELACALLYLSKNTSSKDKYMASSARIDRQHVSLASEVENLYWEAKLGAVRNSITRALCEVGDDPGAIAKWLANHHLARLRLADPRPTAT